VSRVSLVLALAPVVLAAGFGMHAYSGPTEQRRGERPIPRDIVVLGNGTIVEARDGSVAQELVDWLEKPRQSPRVFHLGGVQFEGRSSIPTIAARHRLPALVKMLSAYPEVKARFTGFTHPTGNPVDDQAIEIARANWAIDALVRAGIDPERLSARASIHANEPPAPGALPERVDLELSKE
jgi:outer membrane protein OmpA-like peptidoglycan-associated protein